MKPKFTGFLYLFSFCLFCFSTLSTTTFATSHGMPDRQKPEITRAKMSMPFAANEGQFDAKVKYYAKTLGGTIFVTEDGQWIYSLPKKEKPASDRSFFRRSTRRNQGKTAIPSGNMKGLALKEELVGGKISSVKGEGAASSKANYFRGNDEKKWKTNISTYNMVDLGEVYEGIGLKLKAHGDNVEKLFYVKPGSKPEDIKVRLTGARTLKITDTGELAAETELGTVKL
jgi:hypothetical protein